MEFLDTLMSIITTILISLGFLSVMFVLMLIIYLLFDRHNDKGSVKYD